LLKNASVFSLEQILRPFYIWGANSGTLYPGDYVQIPLRVKLLASLQSTFLYVDFA
jgi:hypothetical protein